MQPLREVLHSALFSRIALPQGPRRHTHLRVQAATIEGTSFRRLITVIVINPGFLNGIRFYGQVIS